MEVKTKKKIKKPKKKRVVVIRERDKPHTKGTVLKKRRADFILKLVMLFFCLILRSSSVAISEFEIMLSNLRKRENTTILRNKLFAQP